MASSTFLPFTPASSRRPPQSSLPRHPSVFSHPSFLLLDICFHPNEVYQALSPIVKHHLASEPFVQNKLVALFSRFGYIRAASTLFASIPEKPDELHHCLLRGHAHHSTLEESLSFYSQMRLAGVNTSVCNLTYLLKNCGDRFDLKRGREVHCQLISNGFSSNLQAMTSVVNMYGKCREVGEARKMFDRMPERDLVTWNAFVASCAQNMMAGEALELLVRMQESGQRPDSITIVSILPACADAGSLRIGKSIHGFGIRSGFENSVNISTAVIDMYAKRGAIRLARSVFDGMVLKNVVTWNSMIVGYASSHEPGEALKLYKMFLEEGLNPTDVTMMGALQACAELGDLEEGKDIHNLLLRNGLGSDTQVMNSLLTMYSKCKRSDLAVKVFHNLHSKSIVSWNAMILGYAQNDRPIEAVNLFFNMMWKNITPDSFTLVSVIPALASISLPRQAKWMHQFSIRLVLDRNIFVRTALIDLYSKCGALKSARLLFDLTVERHVTTWNAMIDGYGSHGLGQMSVNLFEEMKTSPVKPNDVTFLNILSACSHSGLIEEGKRFFESMKDDYGLEPGMEHYGAMVDLLGRSGRLDDAWSFIERMPVKPSITIYGAMLGACKIHKNVLLGEAAAKKLFELEPKEGSYHVLLSNIYASESLWEDASRVRKTMEKRGLRKTPGHSFVEIKNQVHTFYSGMTNHPQAKKIYAKLHELMVEIKLIGYVADKESSRDVEDEVRETWLNSHSEKLAIAFGLMNTIPGSTIQVRKNLRVCGDCHDWTKLVSRVAGREIIVRDMHRFHHFRDGGCSCGDYW